MSLHKRNTGRAGFALVELLTVVVLIAVTLAIVALLLPDARRRSRIAGSLINLQQLGKGAAAFAADNDDKVFSFSWQPGVQPRCDTYAFPNAQDYVQAAANQAVCILRQRGNRPDITQITGWFPHALYNHLALNDYLGDRLPNSIVVSPGDGPRLAWQRATIDAPPNDQGQAFFNLTCRPGYPQSDNGAKRWPYSSSYEMQPSFYSPDAQINNVPTVVQGPTHREYMLGSSQTVYGNRRMSEVRYPSHKAMMYETVQWFFGSRMPYISYPEARVCVLSPEGSAAVRSTNQSNPGFFPNTPTSPNPTRFQYLPELSWEPPTLNGASGEFVSGMLRWTRSGLRGRDFAGPEVQWVP